MITSVAEFVTYFEGVRRRTVTAVDRVTPSLVDGKPRPHEWTFARLDAGHPEEMARLASQLDAWLALAGTEPPQIYGYSMEEALAKAGARR